MNNHKHWTLMNDEPTVLTRCIPALNPHRDAVFRSRQAHSMAITKETILFAWTLAQKAVGCVSTWQSL